VVVVDYKQDEIEALRIETSTATLEKGSKEKNG